MAAVLKRLHGALLLAISITLLVLAGTAYAQTVLTAPGRYVIAATQDVPNVLRAGEALQLEECLLIERIRNGTAFGTRYPYPLKYLFSDKHKSRWRISKTSHRLPHGIARRGKFSATPNGFVGTITLYLGSITIECQFARRVGECDPTIQLPDRLPQEEYYRRSWPSPATAEPNR